MVVDFWATWCDVCTAELRDFVRAADVFGKGIAVVTVSDEIPGVASSYLQHWDIALPLVEDEQGAIFRIYSVSKVPVTLWRAVPPLGAVGLT